MKKQSPKLNFAIQWLNDHPTLQHMTGRTLERIVKSPQGAITYRTWNEAKRLAKKSVFPDEPLDTAHTTIVHINTKTQTLRVTYNGNERVFDIAKMKATTPAMLTTFYKRLGYKYTWLNDDVILLTKKVKALRRAA